MEATPMIEATSTTAPAEVTATTRNTYVRGSCQKNGVMNLIHPISDADIQNYLRVMDTIDRVLEYKRTVDGENPYNVYVVNFPWAFVNTEAVMTRFRNLKLVQSIQEGESAIVLLWAPGMLMGEAMSVMVEWGISPKAISCQHIVDYSKCYLLVGAENELLRIAYNPKTVIEEIPATATTSESGGESENDDSIAVAAANGDAATSDSEAESESEKEDGEVSESEPESDAGSASEGESDQKPKQKKKRRTTRARISVEHAGAAIPPATYNSFARPSFMGLLVGYVGPNPDNLFVKMTQADIPQPISNVAVDNTSAGVSWRQSKEATQPSAVRDLISNALSYQRAEVLELFNSTNSSLSDGPFDVIGVNSPGVYYTNRPHREKTLALDLTSALFQSLARRFTVDVMENIKKCLGKIVSSRVGLEQKAINKAKLFKLILGRDGATLADYLMVIPQWPQLQALLQVNADDIDSVDTVGFYKAMQIAAHDVAKKGYILKRMKKSKAAAAADGTTDGVEKKKKDRQPTGFCKPIPISVYMAEFLAAELNQPDIAAASEPTYPATEVVKAVINYARTHNLADPNPEVKTQIIADEVFARLFDVEVGYVIKHFDLPYLYRDHYSKKPNPRIAEFLQTDPEQKMFMRDFKEFVHQYVEENRLYLSDSSDVFALDEKLATLFEQPEGTQFTWATLRPLFYTFYPAKVKKAKKAKKITTEDLKDRQVVRAGPVSRKKKNVLPPVESEAESGTESSTPAPVKAKRGRKKAAAAPADVSGVTSEGEATAPTTKRRRKTAAAPATTA